MTVTVLPYSVTRVYVAVSDRCALSRFNELKEWEVGGRTERFGTVAHRISPHVAVADGKEVYRGVQLFQMIEINGEWFIHAMVVHGASETLPLPADLVDPDLLDQ